MIIDGGPRKNFNTASMLQKFAEGAASVSNEIEDNSQGYGSMEYCIANALGEPEHLNAYNTYQVRTTTASNWPVSLRRPSGSIATSIGSRTCNGPSMQAGGWLRIYRNSHNGCCVPSG